jgi:hypothetical protein
MNTLMSYIFIVSMMLFALAFLCKTGIRAQERSTKDRNQTIKVAVDLVLVNALAMNSRMSLRKGVSG